MKLRMLPLMTPLLAIYRPGNILSISSPKANNGHRESRGSEDAGAIRKMLKRAGSMQSLLSLGSRRSLRYSVTSVRREAIISVLLRDGACCCLLRSCMFFHCCHCGSHVVAMVDESGCSNQPPSPLKDGGWNLIVACIGGKFVSVDGAASFRECRQPALSYW